MRLRNRLVAGLASIAACAGLVVPAAGSPHSLPGSKSKAGDARLQRWPAGTSHRNGDALSLALRAGKLSSAEYALQRARSIFDISGVRAEYGNVARPGARDATLLLLDLATRIGSLPPHERKVARALLARPTDPEALPRYTGYSQTSQHTCSQRLCVHWETGSGNAPPPDDSDGNGVPDQVDTTLSVFETVWAKEIGEMGYRPPPPDFKPPNQNLDVFLADLGGEGAYGYCALDNPGRSDISPRHSPSFCTVDNDYRTSQYPIGRPLQNLQVTAAHEFFHAIQFGYDYLEDRWFMEGTATWAEDEVFDGANDNYQYLHASALSHPHVSLDYVGVQGEPSGLYKYGNWIFFRFLAEAFGSGQGDPSIVRDAWLRADTGAGAADDYSLEALKNALAARGRSFDKLFVDYVAKNYLADSFYSEGAAYLKELTARPPHVAAFTLSSGERSTGARSVTLNHLAARYVWIAPASDLPSRTTLRLSLDLPPAHSSPSASAIVIPADGAAPRIYKVTLDGDGNGNIVVPFAGTKRVMLALANGSTRTTCGQDTEWSCRGRPADDGQTFRYEAAISSDPAGSDGQPAPSSTAEAPEPASSPSPQESSPPETSGKSGIVVDVSDSPDPFTPNGDGQADKTKIVFGVTRDALVTIKVFNGRGKLVKVIGKNLPTPPGTYFVIWKGRSSTGRRVPNGTYTYVVKAADEAGARDRVRGTTTVRR